MAELWELEGSGGRAREAGEGLGECRGREAVQLPGGTKTQGPSVWPLSPSLLPSPGLLCDPETVPEASPQGLPGSRSAVPPPTLSWK